MRYPCWRALARLSLCGALLPGCLDRMESAADLDRRIAEHQPVDGQVGLDADTGSVSDQDTGAGQDVGQDVGPAGDGGSATDQEVAGATDSWGADGGGGEVSGPDGDGPEATGPDTGAGDVWSDTGNGGGDVVGSDGGAADVAESDASDVLSCSSAIDCNDGNACTVDLCDGGTCYHNPLTCLTGMSCVGGVCSSAGSCGDGKLDPGEQCDDNNQKDGDGCSKQCKVEPPPGMVYIEAGKFAMGCASGDGDCASEEKPVHTVSLSGYFIETKLVAAADYAACVDNTSCAAPSSTTTSKQATFGVAGKGAFPVNYVTWNQAKTYCEVKGRRLCTEAEWEHAARGPANTKYPWGNGPATCKLAQYNACATGLVAAGSLYDGISKFGVLDMAGNVWQWTADGYLYYPSGAITDPTGDDTSPFRVLRGGSYEAPAVGIRSTARYQLAKTEHSYDIGFRCCKTY